jgi:hypothetical protein
MLHLKMCYNIFLLGRNKEPAHFYNFELVTLDFFFDHQMIKNNISSNGKIIYMNKQLL